MAKSQNRMPKFRIGDRITYLPKDRTGTVTSFVNLYDPEDRALQGIRYIIQLSDGWEYSVLENNLKLKDRKKEEKIYGFVKQQ